MGIPLNPEERSPSPEPIYSSDGKRLNTREYRKRKELEELRHKSITRMMDINTDYKPPPDYKPPMIKVSDKVMIPQDEYPEINFVGLLIGPRGNTLKSMERDTGAKIIIRGKGSVKEGKVGRKDGQPLPGEDEPLHAYVTAINPEAVQKAVAKIKEVIKQGVDVPEGQNDLRKTQLRELALLNGTLREGDGPRCTNCGAADHKSWQCQDKPNMTNSIVCSTCGGAGHIAKDCVGRRPGMGFDGADAGGKTKMDDEYLSLMAELGEGPPPAPSADKDSKPWQRGGQGPFHRGGAPRPLMGPGHYGGRGGGRGGFHHAPPPPPGEFESGGGGGNWRQKPPNLMGQSVPPPWSQSSRGGWNQPPPPGAQPPPPGHGPPPPRGAPPPVQYPGHGPPPPSGGGGYGLPPPYMGAPPPGAPPAPASSASASSGSGQWSSGSWSGGPPPPPGASGGYGGGYGGWGGQGGPAPVAPPRSGSGGSGSGGLSLSSLVLAPPPPPPPS